VTAIVADENVKLHVDALIQILKGDEWIEWWDELDPSVLTFADMALSETAPDDVVWHACQRHDAVLITNNRNAKGPTSLESTIRNNVKADSLPVFNFANAERVLQDREYAELVAERLLDYLGRIDEVRGVGRLFLP